MSLKDDNQNVVASFEAKEDFKTLIVSKSSLTNGTYHLYINDEKTDYSYTLK